MWRSGNASHQPRRARIYDATGAFTQREPWRARRTGAKNSATLSASGWFQASAKKRRIRALLSAVVIRPSSDAGQRTTVPHPQPRWNLRRSGNMSGVAGVFEDGGHRVQGVEGNGVGLQDRPAAALDLLGVDGE